MAQRRQLSFVLAVVWWNALVALLAPDLFVAATSVEDEAILTNEIARQNNQSLLWGPYRPNLYFGVRPRIPKSLMTGLMWGKVDTYADFQQC